MCRHFAHREISWMFDQMSRDYLESPSEVWQRRTGLEESTAVRAEEKNYQARIQNGLDLAAEYLMNLWSRGK